MIRSTPLPNQENPTAHLGGSLVKSQMGATAIGSHGIIQGLGVQNQKQFPLDTPSIVPRSFGDISNRFGRNTGQTPNVQENKKFGETPTIVLNTSATILELIISADVEEFIPQFDQCDEDYSDMLLSPISDAHISRLVNFWDHCQKPTLSQLFEKGLLPPSPRKNLEISALAPPSPLKSSTSMEELLIVDDHLLPPLSPIQMPPMSPAQYD